MIRISMSHANMYSVRLEPYEPQKAVLFENAPQKYWRSFGMFWELPVTEPNSRFLAQMCARYNQEVVLEENAKVFLTSALLEARVLDMRAKRRAEYTFKMEAPVVSDYEFGATKPFKHQLVGFDGCRGADAFALFMEMGTGKTFVTIHRMCWELQRRCGGDATKAKLPLPEAEDKSDEAQRERRDFVYRVLVIAPKGVLSNWGRELEKYSSVPFSFAALKGNANDRIDGLVQVMQSRARLKIVAINYDALTKYGQMLKLCQFHLIVADESTRIKSPSAKCTRAAIDVAKGTDTHTPARMILSGQPITKNVLDLFSQCEFLKPTEAILGYTNFSAFKRRYSDSDPYTRRVIPRNVEELKERVGRISFIVKKHECLDLPEKSYQIEEISMMEGQLAFYQQLRAQILAEILAEDNSRNLRVTVNNTLTKMLRLAQVTSGFIPEDKLTGENGEEIEREIKEFTPNPKLDRCIELVDEIVDMNSPDGQKVIIWARFKHDIKCIERELEKSNIPCVTFHGEILDWRREAAIRQFNENPNVRVFVGQPQSGGIGLTLLGTPENPTSTEIFYSNDFNLGSRGQAEDRAHRIGMTVPLTIVDLVVPNSIDTTMLNRLREKRDFSEGFTDAKSMAMALLAGTGES